jgi:long-chain acyl-CoA synthetase
MATGEKLRLEPGARVAIQIPNGLAYPVVAFGIFKAGCVLVNVNPLYTGRYPSRPYKEGHASRSVSREFMSAHASPVDAET